MKLLRNSRCSQWNFRENQLQPVEIGLNGAVVSVWAHNPNVPGSKPGSAMHLLALFGNVEIMLVIFVLPDSLWSSGQSARPSNLKVPGSSPGGVVGNI